MTADKFRERLDELELTQGDVATLFEVSLVTVNRWACGRALVPAAEDWILRHMFRRASDGQLRVRGGLFV